jgi:hypothetical protein
MVLFTILRNIQIYEQNKEEIKKEEFATDQNDKKKKFVVIEAFDIVLGFFNSYVSWNCNTDKTMIERIFRAILAFIFNIFYIFYYIFTSSSCINQKK